MAKEMYCAVETLNCSSLHLDYTKLHKGNRVSVISPDGRLNVQGVGEWRPTKLTVNPGDWLVFNPQAKLETSATWDQSTVGVDIERFKHMPNLKNMLQQVEDQGNNGIHSMFISAEHDLLHVSGNFLSLKPEELVVWSDKDFFKIFHGVRALAFISMAIETPELDVINAVVRDSRYHPL